MKKIGFIDYYISEWHANNYPAWIGEVCADKGLEYKVAYAWAELDVSPKYNETTDEWCEKYGAEKCDTIEELCEKSDVIVILAPSDPEKHLGYAEIALRYGKPTYIDKTFAPDLASAERIYSLADKYGAPMFSTSALRYGEELDTEFACKEITVTGGGSNLPEYIVHQLEILVKKLGIGAKRVKAEQFGGETCIFVDYDDGRKGTVIYAVSMPFTVYMSGDSGEKPVYRNVRSAYFMKLMSDIVRFFETEESSFDRCETLEVMRLREGVLNACERCGEWIEL